MTRKELTKRYLLFGVSLFVMGVGIAITRHGEIGVTPISSIPNVVSLKVPGITFGTLLFIWNCVLLAGQILLLRKNFKPVSLLQIPLSVLFGWFTDIGTKISTLIPTDLYPMRIVCVLLGTVILGFAISLGVTANVILNSGEAFVKALSDTTHRQFSNVKIVFDISCVVTSMILSVILLGRVEGTREGTIIAALTTGWVVKLFTWLLHDPLDRLLRK